MYNLVTPCFGYLGNRKSLTFADLPNVDKFHYIIYLKITYITTATNLIRKVLEAVGLTGRTQHSMFSNFLNFHLKINFYYCQQILSVVLRKKVHLLSSFLRNVLTNVC